MTFFWPLPRRQTEKNVRYTDTFPVTKTAPFEYLKDMTDTQKSYLSQYLEYFGLEEDISASDLFVWLKDHYGVDYSIPIEDARIIIGLRYELEIRVVIGMDEYVFAENVSPDFVSVLEEIKSPRGVCSPVHHPRVQYRLRCPSSGLYRPDERRGV